MRGTVKDWADSVMASQRRIAVPIMTHPGIELARYNVMQAVTEGSVHAEAIIKMSEMFPSAATTAIMDLSVEAEAFGAKTVFEENAIPTVTERLVNDISEIRLLKVPDIHTARIPQFLKANALTAAHITDKPVFAGCIGPFSLAGRLLGLSELMMAMIINTDTVTLLLEKCATFLRNYVRAIKDTGVDGVIMAEPAAGLICNEDCRRFSSDYIRKIAEDVQDDRFIIILHNCGNSGHCTDAMIATGASAYHFGNQADMVEALRHCPADSLVMGNIDPVGILKLAKPAEVREKTLELLWNASEFPNFVLSTGCDVPPFVPMENINAFYDALRIYNKM